MFVPLKLLLRELQRSVTVLTYNIAPQQIITNIQLLPIRFPSETHELRKDTLYLCEYWQYKSIEPHIQLPPILCITRANANLDSVLFQGRCIAIAYGATLPEVLLALANCAYSLGSRSSRVTDISHAFLQCHDLDSLIAEGYRALENPLLVTDGSQRILCCTDSDQVSSPYYHHIAASKYLPVGYPTISAWDIPWNTVDVPFHVQTDNGEMIPAICKPLSVGSSIVGYLHIFQFNRDFEEQDISIAELLGNLIATELWRIDLSSPRSPQDQRGQFLRDILDNSLTDPDIIISRQQTLGITFKRHLYALVFSFRKAGIVDNVPRILLSDLSRLVENTLAGCHCFLYKSGLFMLLETDRDSISFGDFLKPLMPAIRQYHLVVGISNEIPSVLELRNAGYQARKAIQLGTVSHPERDLHHYQDYMLDYMVELSLKSERPVAFCPPGLQALIQYCQEHESDLLDTLCVYLKCSRNKTATAREMFIHINTVKYRIAQIQDITGVDLGNDEAALELFMALKALAYQRGFPSAYGSESE